jgi:Yip1 domain
MGPRIGCKKAAILGPEFSVVEDIYMATTSLPAAGAQPASISAIGRITGVLFSPKATFEDIVRKPSWALPVILLTILSMAVSFSINQRINWRTYMSEQIEKNPAAANLSAEQKEQRIEGGAKFSAPLTYAIGLLGPIIITLIVAVVMWGAYNLLGGANTNFGTSMGITAHAFLTGLVSSPLFILILYLKPYGTVDLDNPVAANVGAFLPDDAAKWLVSLGKSIDVFTFWTLILLAIGFACTNPRKLKGSKSYVIAFSVWAAVVVIKVGFALITG